MATLYSHPCQHLYALFPFDALVQGTGGEFIRGFWVSPTDLDISDLAIQKPLKLERHMSSKTTQHLEQLWKPEFRILGLRAPEEHLNTLLLGYSPQDSPVAAVECLYLQEFRRKYLTKAHLIVRASRDVYLPYLDHQWIEAIAAIPISERVTNRIQVDLIKRLSPTLLDIPSIKNLNYRPPFLAPPWKIWMTKYYRGIRRRVRRKLGLVDNGTVKVVPNHYYSQWTREEMRPTLVELLYNPDAAFRTYLRWETVETLLDLHFSGKDNWEHLVAALTVFEIAHRLWVAP